MHDPEAMKQALCDLIDSMDDRIASRLPGGKKPEDMEAANEPMDPEDLKDGGADEEEEDDGETPKALLAIIKKKRSEG